MASQTELFLDNEMVESSPGVSRRLHPAEKHLLNPVIHPDRWWEGNQMLPYSTMYDPEDKLFKMWLRGGSDSKKRYVDNHAAYMMYLTSTDGIRWDKPELGVVDFAGRRDHNVIFTGDEVTNPNTPPQGKKAMIVSVVKHPRPKDESEKFVGLAEKMGNPGARICTSPDGIRWSCPETTFWKTRIDVAGWGDDALIQLLYDTAKRRWVVYRRIIPEERERMVGNESDRAWKQVDRYYRVFGYTESDDLRTWRNFQPVLSMDPDDPPDTELYNFGCHNYGNAYIGYMSVFHLRHPQPIDVELATSRDGIHFTRVCRGQTFIPHGTLGYYDFMAMTGTQPEPIIVDDTVYIYYEACNFPHNCVYDPDKGHHTAVAVATVKRDRFTSLETGQPEPCRLVTKPFTVKHPKLFLNAATWKKGSIKVEALTRGWDAIPGFAASDAREIQGDALAHPVRWQDNAGLGRLMGKEIRLKFHMTRARIHSMTQSDEEQRLGAIDSGDQYSERGEPELI